MTPSAGDGESAIALYEFAADGDDELTVAEGEVLTVLERDGDEWWKCKNAHGAEGVVPASYLELKAGTSAPSSRAAPSPEAAKHDEEAEVDSETEAARAAQEAADRAEAERLQREEQERAARERKKLDAQRRAKEAAVAAEVERQKRKEAAAAAAKKSPPPQRSISLFVGLRSANALIAIGLNPRVPHHRAASLKKLPVRTIPNDCQ